MCVKSVFKRVFLKTTLSYSFAKMKTAINKFSFKYASWKKKLQAELHENKEKIMYVQL